MVKIELVDRGPAPAYFREFDVPNFVQSPANWGCVNPLPTPASEWFDAAEAATEASNANATAITVTAGATTTANLVINSLPNQLFVSATGSLAQSSPRGVRVPATAGTNVDFFVTGVPPGGFATVFFDLAHTTIPFGAQIAEVNPVAVFSTTANGAGVAQFTIPITPGLARGNFLGQAAFIDAAGNVQLTNSLNMWVTGP
jgi:hypothetical protein